MTAFTCGHSAQTLLVAVGGARNMKIGCQSHSQCYARGHCSLLRPTFPPLRTPHGFACSVASLSRCPCHYRPGRCNFRRAALVERPLGQGKPSTQLAGRNADCCAPATTPHLGDRKAWPLPGEKPARHKVPHLAALAAETRVGGWLPSAGPQSASVLSCRPLQARGHARGRALPKQS